jgi:hypothetical protein
MNQLATKPLSWLQNGFAPIKLFDSQVTGLIGSLLWHTIAELINFSWESSAVSVESQLRLIA